MDKKCTTVCMRMRPVWICMSAPGGGCVYLPSNIISSEREGGSDPQCLGSAQSTASTLTHAVFVR